MRPRHAVTASVLAGFAGAAVLFAGPLNPPAGPVTPTYKTLADIEPRIAISQATTPGDATATFRITQPGSYYLTGNLIGQANKNGIRIESYGVTIDLGGFSVIGAPNCLAAIVTTQFSSELTIRNGTVTRWIAGGVNLAGSDGPVLIENLHVSQISGGVGINCRGPATIRNCRVAYTSSFGIQMNEAGAVSDCTVYSAGNDGISTGPNTVVENCSASFCTGDGFSPGGVIRGCAATNNTAVGILASAGTVVSDCSASANHAEGIRLLGGSRAVGCVSTDNEKGIVALGPAHIERCTVDTNRLDGIVVTASSTVTDNQCRGNGTSGSGAGILSSGVANRIDSNSVFDNDFGIRTLAADNLVTRNVARNNGAGNFSFAVPGETAQIIINPGANFASTNPWANFAY